MKLQKTILSIILSMTMILIPQMYCFATEESTPAEIPSVTLISDKFSTDRQNITAGDTFTLTFNLKNTSKAVDAKSIRLRLSGGEAFTVSNDVDTIYKESLAKASEITLSKSFYCNKSTESGMYPISVSVVYEYTVDGITSQGSDDFSYSIGVSKQSSTSSPEKSPSISTSFSINKKVINNGDDFSLTFDLKNTSSTTDIKNANIKLSGGDAFSIAKGVDTIYYDAISNGKSVRLSKAFHCSSSCSSGIYPISVAITYEYIQNGEKQQGTAEFNYSIKVTKKASNTQSAQLTPQILISDFSYGSKGINGGDIFDLSFTIKNNSETTKVQNITIKLSGGDCFVVAKGTDTISIKSIGAGKTVTINKSFKCLPSAMSGVYPISATVSYEYIEDSSKQSASSDLTMSIPVVQPDKVQFQSVELADKTITVGEETDCAFQIVNSGQTKLSNSTITLIDENGTELGSAYIGNIEPGAQYSSNYTLPVTFDEVGSKKLTLVFEYENENMEKKSVEQEFNVTVEEYSDPFEEFNNEDEIAPEKASPSLPVIIGICVGGAVVIIITAVIIKKAVKKRKARKGSDFNEEI